MRLGRVLLRAELAGGLALPSELPPCDGPARWPRRLDVATQGIALALDGGWPWRCFALERLAWCDGCLRLLEAALSRMEPLATAERRWRALAAAEDRYWQQHAAWHPGDPSVPSAARRAAELEAAS